MARRKNVKRIDPRYFLHETVNRNDDGSRNENAPPLEEIFGLFKSKEEKAQNFFNQNIPKIERAIADAGFSGPEANDILDRVEKHMIEYPTDANAKGIATAVRDSIGYHKRGRSRQDVEDSIAAEKERRRLRHDREEEAEKAAKAAREKKQADYIRDLRAREEMEREVELANIRGSYIPAAGSSTNIVKRRNRGEIPFEEGVDEGLMDKVKSFFGKKGAQPKIITGRRELAKLKNGTFVDDYTEEGDDKAEKASIAATQALWDKDNGESYRAFAAEQLAKRLASDLAQIDYKPSQELRNVLGGIDPGIVSKLDAIWSKGAKGKKAAARDEKEAQRDKARAEREAQKNRAADRDFERLSRRLSPEEKRRAAQERDAKFKSKQYDKDQERMGHLRS